MAQNTLLVLLSPLLLLLFLLSRQFDSFRQFGCEYCNTLLCSSIGVMSVFFVIIPVQKFLIILQVFFRHFYFISLFASFLSSLLICFCFCFVVVVFVYSRRRNSPRSKQKETNLHFCHSNHSAVHKQNSWFEYNREKNAQTNLLDLLMEIELMKHRVIQLCSAYIA